MPTIQDAVQAASPGDIVKIPAGVYDVSNLVLPSNITLQADGNVTIVGVLHVNGSNTVVQGFTFDGGMVDVGNCLGATIRDCVFNDCVPRSDNGSAIALNDASGVVIENNVFNRCQGATLGNYNFDRVTIDHNTFIDCNQVFSFNSFGPASGHDIKFTNNYVSGEGRGGIESGGDGQYLTNLLVDGNTFCNLKGAAAIGPISVVARGDVSGTTITNNYIERGPDYFNDTAPPYYSQAIEIYGSATVSGNTIVDFSSAFGVYGSGASIVGNKVFNTPGDIMGSEVLATRPTMPLPLADTTAPTTALPPADTTAPTVTSIAASGAGISAGAGDLNAGKAVTLTVALNEAVIVAGGTPTMLLNDGGTATYTGGSDSSTLTFTHTVQAGQNVADLAVSSIGLNGATIKDAAGNAANLSAASKYNPAGTLHIDTKAPVVTEKLASGGTTTTNAALTGTGDAGAVVHFTVDGRAIAGTTTADANGAWSFTPTGLAAGSHTIVASETDAAGNTGSASLAFTLGTSSTKPPSPASAPVLTEKLVSDSGASASDNITANPALSGTADAGAVVHFTVDGSAIAATATANSSGAWAFTPTGLADGSHTIVASETNAAGATGTASLSFTLSTHAPIPQFTGDVVAKGKVTLTGTTGEAHDQISIYDGNTWLGFATTGSDGSFSFTAKAASNVVHSYGANATDLAGSEGHGSNNLILGSTGADALTGHAGNDVIAGNGGNDRITGGAGADKLTGGSGHVTFAYNAAADSTAWASDKITDFRHGADKIDFTNIAGITATGGVPTFQGNITGTGNLTLNAHSVAYVEVGRNTQVLVNTSSTAETVNTSDMHAADMKITLVGVHLGLTGTDFHHA